eukprot:CAMPEP_0201721078 /NCGR_PEP_ID=MMETSP0593-20130828/5854_1 /ASSEMBLY_ACC=CAM_ASM_000672 /TAXON_ID=267983 /ORGANISM="Skeletonema japonicum, Strain CCMP2506" /LENGTH=624 /DNA_ID=CAMNT_0048211823 /DNA_START=116 /DNA_END=1987 /DNA_ORIENTATION=+
MPRAKGGSIKPPQVFVNPGDGGLISELNENDVLSGRGGRVNNHPGNVTFRIVVEDYKREYLDPRTRKLEKAHVAARLVAQIRSANPPGRFLKEDSENKGKFVEIGDQKAWKKAGQALREDAPDVRKVLDEEIKDVGVMNHNPYSSPQQQQHQHMQYRPPPPGSVPSGIPPAVTYSPGSHPHQLPPPPQQQHHHRPDPPESEGVTGYRQPPLNYYGNDGPTGRPGGGGGSRGQSHHPSPHQQYSQGGPGMHPTAPPHGYPQPPPPSHHHHHQGQPSPPSSYYGQPPPPQYQQNQPPQNQQHFHQPAPQFRQTSNQYNAAYSTQPNSQQQHQKHDPKRKKSTFREKLPDPTNIVHSAIDSVSEIADKMKERLPSKDSLPPFMSTATDFTMSDVSSFSASNLTKSGNNPNEIFQGAAKREPKFTRTGSGNSKEESFNMSDISLGFSLGRTRSFPDLMLSTGDINLLPALPDESGGDSDDVTPQRTSSGRILRPAPMAHSRQSSTGSGSNESMASLTIRGFHPVRGRTNTQNTTGAMSGLNDAMSIMSIDSHKLSMKSDNSSWMENLKSMQSIHSDGRNAYLHDDTGSVRSLLSDISNDLNALDLAEPLLPPFPVDQSFDSEYMVRRP